MSGEDVSMEFDESNSIKLYNAFKKAQKEVEEHFKDIEKGKEPYQKFKATLGMSEMKKFKDFE